MSGTDVDLLKILSEKLGFTYSFKFEQSWEMDGSIGSIINGTSDLGIGHNAIHLLTAEKGQA